jgi:hypothetical protein
LKTWPCFRTPCRRWCRGRRYYNDCVSSPNGFGSQPIPSCGLAISDQQKVEIIKQLMAGARLLILGTDQCFGTTGKRGAFCDHRGIAAGWTLHRAYHPQAARGVIVCGPDRGDAARLSAGLGFTWGPFMTQIANSVIAGQFKPIFVREGLGQMMAIAPFGPKVPSDVRALVVASADRVAKGFNPFTGPITDNTGVVRIPAGQSLGGDKMGNFD